MRRNLSLKGSLPVFRGHCVDGDQERWLQLQGTPECKPNAPDWLSEWRDLGIEYRHARATQMVDWWDRNGASQYSRIMADSGKSRFSPCSSLAPRSPSCTQRRVRRPTLQPTRHHQVLRHKHLHHVGSLKGGQKRLVAHVVVDHGGAATWAMRPRRESSAVRLPHANPVSDFEAEHSPPSVRQRENAHSRNRSGHRHRRDAQWRPTCGASR